MLMFDFVSASFPLIGTRGRDYVPHFGNLSTIPRQKKNTRISLKKHHFSIFLLAILVLCCKLSDDVVQFRSGFVVFPRRECRCSPATIRSWTEEFTP